MKRYDFGRENPSSADNQQEILFIHFIPMRLASDSLRELEERFGKDPQHADDLLRLRLEMSGMEQAGIGDPELVLRHLDDFRARVSGSAEL